MVILNKDGSVYRLKEPNPLVKEQVMWNLKEDLIFHNCKWEGETQEDGKDLVQHTSDFKVSSSMGSTILIEEPVEETIVAVESVEEELQPQEEYTNVDDRNIIIFHCLPATMRDRYDDLYDDKYKTIQYGEKFTFEGVFTFRGDLAMTFWTNIELGKNSIVYPSTYRGGRKYGEYRWWQINKKIDHRGGHLYETVASNYQPNFS